MQALVRETPERPIDRRFGIAFPKPEEIARMPAVDRRIAQLLAEEAGLKSPITAGRFTQSDDGDADAEVSASAEASDRIDAAATVRPLGDRDVHIGDAKAGPVGIDLARLVEGRMVVQGNSGAGKSMLLRRLFEQSFGRIQQMLIDPDGEFSSLREHFDVAVLTAADVRRIGGHTFAAHLREHRYSAVLDLSDAIAEDRLSIVADLAEGLVETPEMHWHPMLVLVDEAQTLAPHHDTGDVDADTRKRSTAALADLMGRGRKRGLAGIIATQRLAETSKAVVAKATNYVVGRTIFDRDIERAGAHLGLTIGHSRALRTLADGEFIAIGPAIAGPRRVRFRAGPVVSRHKGAVPEMAPPPTISAAQAAALILAVPGQAPAPAEIAPDRRRGWTEAEDAVIRECYAHGATLAEVQEAIIAIGGPRRHLGSLSMRGQHLGLKNSRGVDSWSDAEYQFVLDGYEANRAIADIRTNLVAAGYDRSFGAIQMAAIKLGVSGSRVNLWTDEETLIALSALEAGKTHTEVLADLKAAGYLRGPTAIHKFATKHGVVRKHTSFTGPELERLRDLYGKGLPVAEIAEQLGRTRSSIASQASKMGLKQRRPWTEEERQLLVDMQAAGTTMKAAAEAVGRPYANVSAECGRMGVSFRKPSERTPT